MKTELGRLRQTDYINANYVDVSGGVDYLIFLVL